MKYWITQTGEKIKVSDMTTQHIENVIAMLKRNLEDDPGYQAYMGDSEVAEQAVESENRQNAARRLQHIYMIGIFEKELRKRLPSGANMERKR